MLYVKMNVEGREFLASARQAVAIETLIESRKGGFASIKSYRSDSNYIEPKVSDLTILTRISVLRLYERKIDALLALKYEDAAPFMRASKLIALSDDARRQAFEDRRTCEIESMRKTLAGIRDDAHRQAHDYFNCNISEGVKVHFKTEKLLKETKMVLDETSGLPIVESINLTYIPINEKIIEPGRHKHVNSGIPVLISKAIAEALPRSCKIRTASLKEDKFTSIEIDGNTVVPGDIAGLFT